MGKTNTPEILKKAKLWTTKHSPGILTGVGITGMITATVLAVQATPKAVRLIDEAKKGERKDELTMVETVKVAWKPYIPAAITGSVSIACLIGANSVNARRNAALYSAYKLSETALTEYKEKVIETLGEKKDKTIRESIAKDKVDKDPVTKSEVIITDKGNTLCYDVISGRYFKSDIDRIKRVENELNRKMLREGYISLSEFYNELGLTSTSISDDLGWHTDAGLIDVLFSSQLADDGTPCVVLDYDIAPEYDYWRFA